MSFFQLLAELFSLFSPLNFLTELSLFAAAAAAKLLQSCPTLSDPIDGSPPGSPVPGILPCMKVKTESEVAQSCPTLSNPMDCSLLGSSVHGIFQARVLEWGAIAFSVLATVVDIRVICIKIFPFPFILFH